MATGERLDPRARPLGAFSGHDFYTTVCFGPQIILPLLVTSPSLQIPLQREADESPLPVCLGLWETHCLVRAVSCGPSFYALSYSPALLLISCRTLNSFLVPSFLEQAPPLPVLCCVFGAVHFLCLCFRYSLIFSALDLSCTSERGARQLLEALSSRKGTEGAILLPTLERTGPGTISVFPLLIPHLFLLCRLN